MSEVPDKSTILKIIGRYLKPGPPPWNPKKEMPFFYMLWRQYPSLDFWTRHDLDFRLNSMCWFFSRDGASRLKGDWDTFHFNFPVDNPIKLDYDHKSEDAPQIVKSKPNTIAEFLKSQKNT